MVSNGFVRSLFILTVLSVGCAAAGAEKKIETLKIGAAAPDFNLPAVDDKMYTLSSFAKAEVLVIIFTCNHCPTAQAYEERMKKLTADYKDKGVAVVAITSNDPKAVRLDELGYSDLSDSFEETKIRYRDKKFNFPYLYDGDQQKAARAYGPVTTPHVFIFDRARRLRYVGRIDNSERLGKVTSREARGAIEALLAGKDVPVAVTRPFGCSIKWSDKRGSVKRALEQWAREPVTLRPIDPSGIARLFRNDSGKLRMVNLWGIRCGPCVAEFDDLIEIHRMYRNRDFELVTLSADYPEGRSVVFSLLKRKQASCQNYIFSEGNRDSHFEAIDRRWDGSIPYTVIVKPGGEVLLRHSGVICPLEVKRAIVEYLGRTYK